MVYNLTRYNVVLYNVTRCIVIVYNVIRYSVMIYNVIRYNVGLVTFGYPNFEILNNVVVAATRNSLRTVSIRYFLLD